MPKKDFYSTQELVNQPWFPVKSTGTIQIMVERGELEAVNVGTTDRKRYRITKKSIVDYLMSRKGQHKVNIMKK